MEGIANNGSVSVCMNCRHEIKSVYIKPNIVGNKKELENLFAIAVNDAVHKVEEYTANKMMDNISATMLRGFTNMASAGPSNALYEVDNLGK